MSYQDDLQGYADQWVSHHVEAEAARDRMQAAEQERDSAINRRDAAAERLSGCVGANVRTRIFTVAGGYLLVRWAEAAFVTFVPDI